MTSHHRQRRRSSSSAGGEGPVLIEVPIPVCITLYNLFPHPQGAAVVHHNTADAQHDADNSQSPFAASTTTTPASNVTVSSKARWYRLPDHSKRLLHHSVLLQILDVNESILFYSSVCPGGTVHPSWDLLDERFQWSNTAITKQETDESSTSDASTLWKETYRSLTVRVSLLSDSDQNDGLTTSKNVVLAEAPLYPTMLQRLLNKSSVPKDDSAWRSNNSSNKSSSNNNNMISLQGPQQLLPISLPPNSLVVFFSDGSIRVPSFLFQFLVDRHVLDEYTRGTATTTSSSLTSNIKTTAQEVEDFDRFSDDVFATLDQVITSPSRTTTTAESVSPLSVSRKPRLDVSLLEVEGNEEHEDTQPIRICAVEESVSCPPLVDEDDDEIHTPTFSNSEQTTRLEELRDQQRELQHLIEEEEEMWKREVEALLEDKAELGRLAGQSQSILSETNKIREATLHEMMLCQQAEFTLEACRIKLISELRILYPIQVKSDQRYLIRGLELPRDVHSAVVSEDEVSAAFGFVTHLVGMMSKYLAVPLRYRLYCNSSKSAISVDGVAVFPLFSSRAVEREELDRALQLLHRNVDCLLLSRDLQCPPQTHILAKIQRIYDKIIDGC